MTVRESLRNLATRIGHSPVIFGSALLCFMSRFEIARHFLTPSARFLRP